jgi:hypothetical protein
MNVLEKAEIWEYHSWNESLSKIKSNKFEIWGGKKKRLMKWKSRNIRFKKVQIQEKIRWNKGTYRKIKIQEQQDMKWRFEFRSKDK